MNLSAPPMVRYHISVLLIEFAFFYYFIFVRTKFGHAGLENERRRVRHCLLSAHLHGCLFTTFTFEF